MKWLKKLIFSMKAMREIIPLIPTTEGRSASRKLLQRKACPIFGGPDLAFREQQLPVPCCGKQLLKLRGRSDVQCLIFPETVLWISATDKFQDKMYYPLLNMFWILFVSLIMNYKWHLRVTVSSYFVLIAPLLWLL